MVTSIFYFSGISMMEFEAIKLNLVSLSMTEYFWSNSTRETSTTQLGQQFWYSFLEILIWLTGLNLARLVD